MSTRVEDVCEGWGVGEAANLPDTSRRKGSKLTAYGRALLGREVELCLRTLVDEEPEVIEVAWRKLSPTEISRSSNGLWVSPEDKARAIEQGGAWVLIYISNRRVIQLHGASLAAVCRGFDV